MSRSRCPALWVRPGGPVPGCGGLGQQAGKPLGCALRGLGLQGTLPAAGTERRFSSRPSALRAALRPEPAFQPQRASLAVFGFTHLLWNCFPVEEQPQMWLLFYCNVGGPRMVAVARGSWASASLRSPGPAPGLLLGRFPAAAGALGAEVGPRAALPPRVPGCTLCLGAWWAQATDSRDRHPLTPGPAPPPAVPGTKAALLSEPLDLLPDHGSGCACALLRRVPGPPVARSLGCAPGLQSHHAGEDHVSFSRRRRCGSPPPPL